MSKAGNGIYKLRSLTAGAVVSLVLIVFGLAGRAVLANAAGVRELSATTSTNEALVNVFREDMLRLGDKVDGLAVEIRALGVKVESLVLVAHGRLSEPATHRADGSKSVSRVPKGSH